MKRTSISVVALSVLIALAVAVPAHAASVVRDGLGRNAPTYTSYPNDPTPTSKWVQSAQGQAVDTDGNGTEDSLRGRAADLESFGIVRHRILDVKLQRNVNASGGDPVWATAADNEVDAVSPQATAAKAFIESFTPTVRYCDANPALQRQYRVINYSVSRRVDNIFPNRDTFSHTFVARALANDPLCQAPPRTVIDPASPFRTLDTGTSAVEFTTPCVWSPSSPEFAADQSNIVNATTVDLIRVSDDADNCLGTSLTTNNLGYTNTTAGPVTVSVSYALSGGASAAGDSVRMFGYTEPDTALPRPSTAPDYVDVAVGDGGVLSFPLAPGESIGYFGLVYDTSNGGVEGTVRFTNLTIGGRQVAFS